MNQFVFKINQKLKNHNRHLGVNQLNGIIPTQLKSLPNLENL